MENWLTPLKTIIDISVLIQTIGLTPETQKDFWKNMLATLHGEPSPLTGMTQDSLMDYIEKNCDCVHRDHGSSTDPIFVSKLYDGIVDLIEGGEDEYWNESVQKLIQYIIDNFDNNNDNILLPLDTKEHSITIADLKNSDAGYNFPIGERANEEEWVHPWWNIDDKNYDEVRKKDEVLEILKNDTAMQYTREAYDQAEGEDLIEKWLRLLMPQYGRRVEIEDLDRNFWVIAQVISAISNYLFGTDGPIPKTLQGLTREVSELWENVLYLWTEIAVINQTAKSDIRFVHIPLPPRESENCRHYDKFDKWDELIHWSVDASGFYTVTFVGSKNDFITTVEKRLSYLCDQYSEQDLVVMPYLRFDNYKHNYYGSVYYPGFFIYYQKTQTWEFKEVCERNGENEYAFVISLRNEHIKNGQKRFSPFIYGTNQDYNGRIMWLRPFDKAQVVVSPDGKKKTCYGNLRITPFFNSFSRDDEGKITISTGSSQGNYFIIEDAARKLVDDSSMAGQPTTPLGYYTYNNQTQRTSTFGFTTDLDVPLVYDQGIHVCDYGINRQGYYMGETVSWKKKTAEETSSKNLFTDNAYVLKIGNYLPTDNGGDTAFTMSSVKAGSTYKFTSMRGNVTKTRVYNSTNTNTRYYRFRWDTYNKAYDGSEKDNCPSGLGNNICYSQPPVEKSCKYPTTATLNYDGLVAVKNFIKAYYGTNKDISKNPAFFVTTVGLTPWQGGGRTNEGSTGWGDVYWDSSLVHAMYFYIPSVKSLTGLDASDDKNDLSGYINAYNSINMSSISPQAGQLSPGEAADGSPEVKVGDTVLGKVVMCAPIGRYEGYFYNYGDSPTLYYVIDNGRWRQFYVINDKSGNSCYRIDINGGASQPDGMSRYTATFIAKFIGNIKYFDVNRFNHDNCTGEIFNSTSSQVSDARISIDMTNGYRQDTSVHGKIVQTDNNAAVDTFNNRANIAYLHSCTGFQQPVVYNDQTHTYSESPDNIMSKIANCENQHAAHFHGSTPLYWPTSATCKYIV